MFTKLFTLFSLLFIHVLYSQNIDSSYIQVDYNAAFLIDTAKVNHQSKENTTLLIGKNTSLFKSSYKAIADSLGLLAVKKSMDNPVNGRIILNTGLIPSAKFKPEVYSSDRKIMIFDQISRDEYNFEAPHKIVWKLENETKMIQGYQCRKAICKYGKKDIIAWYADSIPIQEGPYTFKGLPGLVLEAYDSKSYFHFSMIGLRYIKKPIPKLPLGINTTYEKFYKKRKERLDDPISSYITTFGRLPPKDSEEAIIRNIRSINNFLD